MTALPDSWRRACAAIGVAADPALGERLMQCYAEPHRGYHTLQHLGECIATFETVADQAVHAGEVEIALWFHDAIYDVHATDNEERSARWAAEYLSAAGAARENSDRVHAMVLATRHAALPDTPDAQLLVDIDLSILGASPGRFDEYETQVRREYAWVPEDLFRRKRAEVLNQFLLRPAIYATPGLHARLEAAARANLQRSIAALAG